ncbi:LapA family protein [Sphingomonas montana]|uniref:LapA family protein n=1 Tax=Sphingomonas montana TaxID=1843236 RepID=UPI00096CBC82|nr:LapA family protein [Sphingomonas montana]
MQFLRTLFWVVLAVIAVIFATKNWTTAQVNLWGGIVADVKLPVLLLIAFLAGLLPPSILYQANRWRLRRRIDSAERTIAELRPTPVAPAATVPGDPVEPLSPTAYTPPPVMGPQA